MKVTRHRRAKMLGSLLAGALFVGACGSSANTDGATATTTAREPGSSSSSTKPDGPTTTRKPAVDGAFALPAVDVLNVANGSKVPFGQLSPSEKPLLLWFWAPH